MQWISREHPLQLQKALAASCTIQEPLCGKNKALSGFWVLWAWSLVDRIILRRKKRNRKYLMYIRKIMIQTFVQSPLRPRAPFFPLASKICLYGALFVMSACSVTEETLLPPEALPGPVRGFQIQIHTTEENTVAQEVAEEASIWLASLDESLVRKLNGSTEIPVHIKWLQPYYRVRVGNYRTREEARGMMAKMAEQFPAAFIVPDTIQEGL